MGLLNELNNRGRTIVVVTHDPAIAAHTQRTIHLMDGLVADVVHNGKPSATAGEGRGDEPSEACAPPGRRSSRTRCGRS